MGRRQWWRMCWLCGTVLSGLLISPPSLAGLQTAGLPANVSEQYLKVAADQERVALGRPLLRLDAALSAAAHRHAAMMAGHKSISHRYVDEPDLRSRAAAAGARFSLITENVAQAPTAVAVHSAWMRSEEHKQNLLDPRVDAVGISVVERDGQMFAVEDFARSVALLAVSQQEEIVARALRTLGVAVAPADEEVHRVCAEESSAKMRRPPEFITRYTTDDLDRLPSELLTQLQSGRYRQALVAACLPDRDGGFSMFRVAVLLYRDMSGEPR